VRTFDSANLSPPEITAAGTNAQLPFQYLHLILIHGALATSSGSHIYVRHTVTGTSYIGEVQCLPLHGVQCVLISVDHMVTDISVQQTDTSHEYTGMFSLDGGTKVSCGPHGEGHICTAN
jgi:low temperature requirement protein LtrA